MATNGDNHTPHEGGWKFDESVTANFDAMLKSSIPNYEVMRDLTYKLGRNFVKPGTNVVDMGASRGEALSPFVNLDMGVQEPAQLHALEISEPMLEVLATRFGAYPNVEVTAYDLCNIENTGPFAPHSASLILSILTIQFIPVVYRQKIVAKVYDALRPGGAFIFVEKILGSSHMVDELMVNEYHKYKEQNGYSYEDIQRKRASLESSMYPHTADSNEKLLSSAGFHNVDCFYRYLNFAGWIAVK